MTRLTMLFTLLAGPALAHPGHAAPPVTHWLSDAAHLGVAGLFLLVLLMAVLPRLGRREDKR